VPHDDPAQEEAALLPPLAGHTPRFWYRLQFDPGDEEIAMSHLHVEHISSQDGRSLVYRLSGVLGESSYSYDFSEELRNRLKDGPDRIVLNLENLEYITSSGVGIIAAGFTSAMRSEKQFVLCSVPKKVRRVLDICGILDVVKAYDTEDGALNA
jgi:anti-anti-sigma factor